MSPKVTDFSPREIVSEPDRFIIAQADARRVVAIALRNHWRRLLLRILAAAMGNRLPREAAAA